MVGVAPNSNAKEEKMKKIFDKFDTNKDEHLDMMELSAWIMAVQPTLNDDLLRVPSLLSLYFANYRSFLVASKGLSYTGFTRIYLDGLRNVYNDFNTLDFEKTDIGSSSSVESQPINSPTQSINSPIQPMNAPVQHMNAPIQPMNAPVQPINAPIQQVASLQAEPTVGQRYAAANALQSAPQQQLYRLQQLQQHRLQQLRQQQQLASLPATNYSNNPTFSNNNLINSMHTAGQVNNYRNTTQQLGGGISSSGQGGWISSPAQVNSYGNSAQQAGRGISSSALVNGYGNSAQQVNAEEGAKPKAKYNGPHPQLAAKLEKEILDTDPGVKWDNVAGLSEAKKILQEAMVLPPLFPEYFQGIRRPWRGVLMFGPPGTGKTLLAKAVATECGTTFMNISSTSLLSKWYGESTQLVRCLFDVARAHAPTTIFIDEIDSLCSARGSATEHEASRRVKSELLVQIDGLSNSTNTSGKLVTLLAATNFPESLDEALRRRLEKRIYIPLPDFTSRKELIKINLKSIALAPGLNIDQVARRTEGYSGDDLTSICRDASFNGMRGMIAGKTTDEIKKISKADILKIPVTMDDFLEALDKIQPSVSAGDIQRHEKWNSEFGST
ncbi:katanin p60 ATPase-containing subunit A1-like isoform X1 [Lycium ferocissimum]|uniref:katanin p60 ATPase-containing subunit A1-like isoform X1 n=1 Tax=Lycium ferocissimum TaxID=112874 RepID=UPI00281609FB|nr:katanin p60 ATPase-containing subunit A1-like isoform X1 [Lycium ferocissimum]XP_059311829.1 katanin p60 ATPase-containing subunit A1-like isoform X1 [Lycium ferocissimum]